MAPFDIYAHPDSGMRKKTPYLLDVQNNYIDRVSTRVVAPMHPAEQFAQRMSELNPVFRRAGKDVVLDTSALVAFPATELKNPLASLDSQSATMVAALDALFGVY